MEVNRLKQLVDKLRARAAQARESNVSGVVGYTASYALAVHEDLEARHKPGKQAKYLEQPARTEQPELKSIIFRALKQGKTMGQAILLACLRLLRESQRIVPVDTGNLKGSGFVRLEN